MLSTGAFNALLKTLEEPPPHAVFIFATTEVHKIPITILSRVQRYDFRLVLVGSVSRQHLGKVLDRRGDRVPSGRAGSWWRGRRAGSVRDSLSLAGAGAGDGDGGGSGGRYRQRGGQRAALAADALGVADRGLVDGDGAGGAGARRDGRCWRLIDVRVCPRNVDLYSTWAHGAAGTPEEPAGGAGGGRIRLGSGGGLRTAELAELAAQTRTGCPRGRLLLELLFESHWRKIAQEDVSRVAAAAVSRWRWG